MGRNYWSQWHKMREARRLSSGRAGMHVAFKAKSNAVYKKHAWDAIPYSTSQRMISMESMALSSPISIIIL